MWCSLTTINYTRVKVQSGTVLCGLLAVVELIKYYRAHGPRSLETYDEHRGSLNGQENPGKRELTDPIQCPSLSRKR